MDGIWDKIKLYKDKISKLRPFEGEAYKQLRDYYRISLTWSSNALEGNSLTEVETKVLLEDGLTIGGKPLRDTLEAVGHSHAYDYMFGLVGGRRLTVDDIKALHRLFYKSIDEKNAGVWRENPIIVTGTDYVFPAPIELGKLMAGLGQWIDDKRDTIHPVRFAAMLHLKFVSIHPFIDGNGRVARLMMNTALIQDGYMLAVIPPILRNDYLSAIRQYQLNLSDEAFCNLIAECVYESEKEIMRLFHIPF